MKTDNQDRRHRGRPSLGKGISSIVAFRLSKEQNEAILKASQRVKKEKSEWIRDTLILAASH